ncbi:MAG: ABC transporter permease subunit [Clostridiales bacterium]|jgi:putative aldouronate transport system permease protein|nr:ABC transporter permease subunit [Clostridiales bacterium]
MGGRRFGTERTETGLRGVAGELWRNKLLYAIALPAIAYTFVFGYLTLPYLAVAFEKYSFKTGLLSKFVGLDNFMFFFKSSWAWTVTRNTVVLNFMFIIVCSACSILLALLVSEVNSRFFSRAAQSFMLFPYFISWVIVSYILNGLMNTDTGLINNVVAALGGAKISFYTKPDYWYPILVFTRIWKTCGYTSIIYLAVITGIDEGLYEAACIDGATRLTRIARITLPLLLPTVCILTLMDIGRIFYGDFGMFYAIVRDNGTLMPITEVIDTYVYRVFKTTGDPGVSMAIGLYQSLVGFALVFGSNWMTRRLYPEGALF